MVVVGQDVWACVGVAGGFGTSDLALTFDDLIALAQRRESGRVRRPGHLLDVASSELQVLTPRELADRLGLASAG